jgi:hypothetical protein
MPGLVLSVAADGTGGAFATGDAGVPFIARIAPDGSMVFNTPLPTLGSAEAVAVDPNGNAVVCGIATNGSIVLLHIDSSGAVSLSSVVGSSTSTVAGSKFILDAEGNAYVTGTAYVYDSGLPDLGRVHTNRSASTIRAKDRKARNKTSSFSKREKMRRNPLSLRKSRSISLRFL